MNRPLSIREIQANKAKSRKKAQHKYKIKNLTSNQNIPIQLLSKDGTNSVLGQQTIHIAPGKSVELPYDRVMKHQLSNLKRTGLISYHETNTSEQK
jgi:hypothetical protein